MEELIKTDEMQINISKEGNIEINSEKKNINLSKNDIGFIKKVQEIISK